MIEQGSQRDETRARIVEVAGTMLRERGAAAVTTRAVADGAGVQAPTIYRLFGDKDGLLEAVAEHAMATFSAMKADAVRAARDEATDPIEDLRTGWSMTIGFGLANPDLFVLLSDPERGGLDGRKHRKRERWLFAARHQPNPHTPWSGLRYI